MNDNPKRTDVLRAVLEDIALDLALVIPEKEFVVEEKKEFWPCLREYFGPFYIIYGGRKEETERKAVIAVSQKTFNDTKNKIMFSPAHYFMQLSPFILEYLTEYAREFRIGSIRYKKEY